MDKKSDSFQKAKDYAYLLLKFRPRSEKELQTRLKKKNFNDTIIKNTLSFLKEKGFIDDNYFAKIWIESRIKKPLGLRRIRQELKLKGIDKEIIEREISQIQKSYSELDTVTKVAQVRFAKLKGIDYFKAKRRVYEYLLRRGFSLEVITDVINRLNLRSTYAVG